MIASLGMYDRAETHAANDRLWAGIRDGLRANGIDAPQALTRGEHAYWDAWQSDDLVFSQTCGYPFRARLHGKVTLIGTPDYGLPGCPSGHYNSVFVARMDDPRQDLAAFSDARFAYNEDLSQSGWAAPQNHAIALGLRLAPGIRTGGHRLSAIAVSEGRADLAAIDALTWAMLTRWEPWTSALREVGRTAPPTPVLPFITRQGEDAELFFSVLDMAVRHLSPADRDVLHLQGLVRIPAADYLAVPTPPSPERIAEQIAQSNQPNCQTNPVNQA